MSGGSDLRLQIRLRDVQVDLQRRAAVEARLEHQLGGGEEAMQGEVGVGAAAPAE